MDGSAIIRIWPKIREVEEVAHREGDATAITRGERNE